jgi:hypothetical protein
VGVMNGEVAVIRSGNSDCALAAPKLLQRLGGSSSLRSSVRWIVEWGGDGCAPRKIFEAARDEKLDVDWCQVMSTIEVAAEAAGETHACMVAVGYPEEWHVSVVENGAPCITVAFGRSCELASMFSPPVAQPGEGR